MVGRGAQLKGGPAPARRQPSLAAAWRRLRTASARAAGRLPEADECAFGLALDRRLSVALPVLGTVFGAGVILFSAWDYWIAPYHAGTTLMLRVALVLAGAAGYLGWSGRFPVAWRCALVYLTHACAMILSAAMLPGGLVLALPAITGAMFPLALVEPRLRRLFAMTLPPAMLFLVLAASVLSEQVYASCALVYALVLALVAALAVFQGRQLRKEFMAERALTWSVRHDSLCGILARGYLLELAAHDLALARRYGHPLALAMLDIDYFKRVNDTFGHSAGDALLCAVSNACAGELRASDYLGRYGGEEFVCVMPETGEVEALACAERMRAAVGAVRLALPAGEVRCTISIGVAALAPWHADVGQLLAASDGAMYRAKSNGRDRVELAAAASPAREDAHET